MDELMLDEMVEEVLDRLRPYYLKEQALSDQIANCETEADLHARQRHALRAEMKELLQATIEAYVAVRLSR